MDISKVQSLLVRYQVDGWLFTDFHGHDFITKDFLKLTERRCTRRLFYFIPVSGEPVKLLSEIEPLLLDHLPGSKVLYKGKNGMQQALQRFLKPGMQVACQYSPEGNVPVASSMDAGLAEYLRTFGITLVTSADLLQHFGAVLTEEQIESHRQAGVIIHRILDQTFAWIRENLDAGRRIDEWMMLQKMKELIAAESIEMSSPPFFGIDEHGCDPGYEPKETGSKEIQEGCRLIIDIAGRIPGQDTVYYDISWCMNIGPDIDPGYQELFDLVKKVRQADFDFIQKRLDENLPVRGCDVDALTQKLIREAGYERCIMHRTGHNIGHEGHGIGANLDDYETHDTRTLLPGTMFSIEPGIYTENYGVRLEYDVHITPERRLRIYGPVQEEILII